MHIGRHFTVNSCTVEPCDASDHQLALVDMTVTLRSLPKEQWVQTRKPPIRSIDMSTFRDQLASALLDTSTDTTTTTCQRIQLFQHNVSEVLDKHCPMTTVKLRGKYKPAPWVDDELRKLLFRRKRSHRKMRKNPADPQLVQNFRTLRRQCKLLTRRKQATFFQNEFIYNRKNPRGQWNVLNTLLGRIKIHREPGAEVKAITATFSEIVSPGSPTTPTATTHTTLPLGPMPEHNFCTFDRIPTSLVEFYLKRLDCRKACGPDNVPAAIYKSAADGIAPVLAPLFSDSLQSGTFPTPYKQANVRPIHKRGDHSDPTNYRPISLLPQMSKLLERCALDQLMEFVRDAPQANQALPPEQFAYRRQHSCDDLLALVANDWQQSLDAGKFVVAAFLDMSKAFDTVNHNMLLQELFEIGVGDSALQWFASYLRGRRQRVVTRTSRGELYEAHRGVPQGSTLGPVLFNLSVRKLPSAASSSMVRQYADDVALYLAGRNLQQTTEELARDVCRIRDFLSERGLILNASKTQFIVFHSRSKKVCSSLRLTIDNVLIPPATTVKYLGMTFDQHLTFADHISALERKVGDKLAVFRRIRDRLTIDAKRTFYCAFIQAQLEYGSNAFYHSLQAGQQDRLTCLSNRAVRTVFGYPRFCDISTILARYHLASISLRLRFKLFVLIYRSLHKVCSPLLTDCFVTRVNATHTASITRSQVTLSLALPPANNRYGLYALSFLGADRWNSLPASVRICSTLSDFCSSIQKHIGYPVRRP